MKKLIALLLLATTPAWALKVNGPLEGARLEALSSDPASGPTGRIIYNTTEAKAKIHTGSSFVPLGSGSGAGGLYAGGQNLIVNNSFEQSVTGWTSTSGIGSLMQMTGAAFIVPPGVGSARWIPTAGAQTMTGTGITITANDGISGQNGVLSCAVKTTMTDLKMQVYDGTNVISPNGTADVVPSSSAGFKRYAVNFVFPASGTISPRFLSGSAGTAYIDDCYLGLAEGFNLGIADVITDWTVYTPTIAGVSTSATAGRWRRVGDSMEIMIEATVSASPSGTISAALPAGYTMDTAKITSPLAIHSVLGIAYVNQVNFGTGDVIYATATTVNVVSHATGTAWSSGVPGAWANGQYFSFFLQVPIVGWTGQNVISPNQTFDRTGEIMAYATACPGNTVATTAKTIGNASGDYQGGAYYNLYSKLWSATLATSGKGVTISAGPGLTAAADWAAGRTIKLDLQDLFLRGIGTSNTALGSYQADALQGHRHGFDVYQAATGTTGGYGNANSVAQANQSGYVKDPITDGTNGTPRTASETRPMNVGVNYCVNYTGAQAAPLLVGSVTSNTSGMERVERARMLISAACAITDQSGSWISSPSGCVSGQAAFAISGFGGVPACTVSPYGTSAAAACTVRSLSQTSATIACFTTTTGAAVDVNASLVCMGPK